MIPDLIWSASTRGADCASVPKGRAFDLSVEPGLGDLGFEVSGVYDAGTPTGTAEWRAGSSALIAVSSDRSLRCVYRVVTVIEE